MRNTESIAAEVLACALSWEPEVRLLGNVKAKELVRMTGALFTSCPDCGAEPWVNIDCDMCIVLNALLKEQDE